MCKSRISGSSIEHFYNNNYQSSVLNALNPTVGISNAKVSIINNSLVCSLTRDNTNNQQNYFQITKTTNTFLIMAYGSLGNIINFKFIPKEFEKI
jgi:hypothetical protein